MIIPDADEVLPGLWVGQRTSCLPASRLNFTCMCVAEAACDGNGCFHHRITDEAGKVPLERLVSAGRWIDACARDGRRILVHCVAGMERSPLTVAMWLVTHTGISLDEAYAWLKARRAIVEDRRSWIKI